YGDVTISTTRFDKAFTDPQNLFAFVRMSGGVTAENTQRLQQALARFPDAKIQTKDAFTKNQERGINLLLSLLYVLLSLSIVIAPILAGILAAIFPARRAARLNVLEALQYE